MFHVMGHYPAVAKWQTRLAKVPRWGWWAIGIGIVLPIVVILASVFLLAVLSGIAVFVLVMLVVLVRNMLRRAFGRKPAHEIDGNRIVVRSVRVVE